MTISSFPDTPLTPEEEAYRQAMIARAREEYANDDVEIDDDARLSEADEGCWVQAWVWLDKTDDETDEVEDNTPSHNNESTSP